MIHISLRFRVTAQVTENSNNIRILNEVSNIEVLATPTAELSELDSESRDQASRMLMSRICKDLSDILRSNNFVEFQSRVISKRWDVRGSEARQGVGLQLVTAVEKMAIENGATEIFIEASLSAEHFYKRCGYSEQERIMRPMSDGQHSVDMEAIHMVKKIDLKKAD